MSYKIVAVVGMCGSGKSVAVEQFEKRGFYKVYFGGATFIKMEELGLEKTPENERKVRNDLRKNEGMGAYAKIFLPILREKHKETNIVIDGLYSWSEYKIIKEEFKDDLSILCIATDAPLRRKRLEIRGHRPLTKEESLARDYSEIENIEKGGPIGIADHYILNNGSAFKFKNDVVKYIKKISK